MPTTERLYYNDSHLIEFEAQVTDKTERVSGWTAVTLDRTAFFPTGGGQPTDTGILGGARVLECIDTDENEVLHVIQGRVPEVGATVKGRVDWPRRLDHIQQHTGQHILSQAFVTLFDAPTKGFRVLEQSCEIDVELSNPANDLIERAVELANNVIWEDRQITIKTVTPEEAAELPLRKEPARDGELRVIEIEGFDLTPCGGTHANRTGEVGMIGVRGWERAKGLCRIEFLAGGRASRDYRRANKTARAVAGLFSSARDDATKLAARMIDENKELHRRLRVLEEVAAESEAAQLVENTGAGPDGMRVISRIFDNRDSESVKRLAMSLISYPSIIALLGSREGNSARLVFAKSTDASGDMNALMKDACAIIEGRGGGKPDMAQGGGKNVDRLGEALAVAAKSFE
ncbi:MAG: DHHA1 domain-containing protein [Pyrinomonadaceae bacterium]